MNANSITPSIPIIFPTGSRYPAIRFSSVASPTYTFPSTQRNRPAGAATITALPRTYTVRSSKERTMTFPICGVRYGGNSRTKDDGFPLRSVDDKSFETTRVTITEVTTKTVRISADKSEPNADADPMKNIEINAISVGNLPLQGIKEFVRIAISLSLSESIILHPVTPTELQPSPMHMRSA